MYSLFARIRQLILPQNALPDDAAIIIGPDLPPCMQAAYSSAIFFRPPGTVSGGVNAPPSFFIAQKKTAVASTEEVDLGYAVYDGATVCGYARVGAYSAANTGGGVLNVFLDTGTIVTSGFVTVNQVITTFRGEVDFPSGLVALAGPVTIDAVSIGRGIRASASSTVNSAAIGAEAVVLTQPGMTFFNGRAYRWEVRAEYTASAPNFFVGLLRVGSVAGAQVGSLIHTLPTTTTELFCDHGYIKRVAGSDLATNLVQTVIASAGTVTQNGSAASPRWFNVFDCGAVAQYPDAVAI